MGPLGHEASEFLTDMEWCLSLMTNDARLPTFLTHFNPQSEI